MPLRLSTAVVNGMANAAVDLIDSGGAGTIEIRTGTQPTTANDSASGTSLLATFTLDDPEAFTDATAGVVTLNGTPLTVAASGTGTAAWFRVKSGAGDTVFDGTVGTSGQQLNLNTTAINESVNVTITSGSFTMPAASA